ncbi:MAG: mechanosensitive ion channel family protein [Microlunatus sp.]|nr:mechanosensitive ion channel family protein [Microlunatus sp.]MDN5770983.1 mechanosensitive ion channel family protein [Microlunatus sp.]MDN5804197.1 mechanosensitive ion channel family protein [Microlunatus sp.]
MAVSLTQFLISLGASLAATLVVFVAARLATAIAARRWRTADLLHAKLAAPFRFFVLALALTGVVAAVRPEQVPPALWEGLYTVLRLVDIGTGAWLVGGALVFVADLGLSRYQLDGADNLAARRRHTQVRVIRRLTVAVVVLIAIGAGLLTLPGVRAVGASLLASAGLISVVAAVAAQSTLANVFAGIQLAFNDALRLDDVVVVEEQYGRVDELTLSYVVVRLWDDRNLVLPSTYFTSEPFENWTRRGSEIVGTVEVDLDWRTDVAALRDHLDQVLSETELWDGRSRSLSVTGATEGMVRVRAAISATDASTLWDLRCHVREQLVSWAREHAGSVALPRQRVELVGGGDRAGLDRPAQAG